MSLRRIALLSTGGTIEKTYDELSGVLKNEVSVLDVMLASLELRGVAIDRVRLMNKDSLDMSDDDHTLIAHSVRDRTRTHDGVVVVHGTDRLALTGDRCVEVTASARNCPPSISGAALATVVNITWIWPPITSVMAGAAPLYGTVVMLTLAVLLSRSPARCAEVPVPKVP